MTTPMMKQYKEIKAQYADCILFFRLGDFYEMFGDDAVKASKILNITLTKRNKGTENETPMCGIPFHAAEGYIAKLTQGGFKVAVCEQVSDPSEKGIVQRDVVRVVTPATTMDAQVLDANKNNYLVSLSYDRGVWGIAKIDMTTGSCMVTQTTHDQDVYHELLVLRPAEVLITKKIDTNNEVIALLMDISLLHVYAPTFFEKHDKYIAQFFSVHSLDTFGITKDDVALEALAHALRYLQETQKTTLPHIQSIVVYSLEDTMLLDVATFRNLDILVNSYTGKEEGSLYSVINETETSMGARLLRHQVCHPLKNLDQIVTRHRAVACLMDEKECYEQVDAFLQQTADIERLVGRIASGRFSPRDFVALRESLQVHEVFTRITNLYESLHHLKRYQISCSELMLVLEQAFVTDPPAVIGQGDIVAEGYDARLDEVRSIARHSKEHLALLQTKEIERTGIKSLKIKYNKIFGYYIEIPKTHKDKIPEDYEIRQTLVQACRCTTPELQEYEYTIMNAQDEILTIEMSVIENIRQMIIALVPSLLEYAQGIALLDMYRSFAKVAHRYDYVAPEMTLGYDIEIIQGRHPVIERLLPRGKYIPNDVIFNEQDHQLLVLTGPNMSGKSSFLRQTALIVLLAQIGSFVPAQSARIGVVDRIFTRVGASDNLTAGQSTFMMEMQEAAYIITNATRSSLIIFDELGRGTSTYDGVSIAWAIVSYIHDAIGAKTIFATHYHELIELANALPYAQNYSVAVAQDGGTIIFLHKVIPGGISQSYGIHVAQLAGLPQVVIAQARTMLAEFELKHPEQQILFSQSSGVSDTKITQILKNIDINVLTPLEALQTLKILQDNLNSDENS